MTFGRHDADVMPKLEGVVSEDDEVDDARDSAVVRLSLAVSVVLQADLARK